jgi:hypothetical protein
MVGILRVVIHAIHHRLGLGVFELQAWHEEGALTLGVDGESDGAFGQPIQLVHQRVNLRLGALDHEAAKSHEKHETLSRFSPPFVSFVVQILHSDLSKTSPDLGLITRSEL